MKSVSLRGFSRNSVIGFRGGELEVMPPVGGLLLRAIVFQFAEQRLPDQQPGRSDEPGAGHGDDQPWAGLHPPDQEINLRWIRIGVAAVLMARMLLPDGYDFPNGLALVAITAGMSHGALHGLLITIEVPSFIVTLGGCLAWNGVVLMLPSEPGIDHHPGPAVVVVPAYLAGGLDTPAVLVVAHGVSLVARRNPDQARLLFVEPSTMLVLKIEVLPLQEASFMFVANTGRGIPLRGRCLIAVCSYIALDIRLKNTRFGVSVYAISGSIEAARRPASTPTA